MRSLIKSGLPLLFIYPAYQQEIRELIDIPELFSVFYRKEKLRKSIYGTEFREFAGCEQTFIYKEVRLFQVSSEISWNGLQPLSANRAVTLLNLGGTARFPVISSQEYLFWGEMAFVVFYNSYY